MTTTRSTVQDPTMTDDPPPDRLAASTLRALRAKKAETPAAPAAEPDDADVPDAVIAEQPGADEAVAVASPTSQSSSSQSSSSRSTSSRSSSSRSSSSRSSWPTVACAVLAFAALVFAVVAGVTWWTAGHSGQRRLGLARDQVAVAARLDVATVNTSDYRHPDAALSNWLSVSTGSLHSQFAQSRTTAIKLLAEAKMITRATVLDAAVTDVDLGKGTASVLASVNVTRTPASGSPTTVRNRFRATLTRVGGSWKLSNLTVVPVGLS